MKLICSYFEVIGYKSSVSISTQYFYASLLTFDASNSEYSLALNEVGGGIASYNPFEFTLESSSFYDFFHSISSGDLAFFMTRTNKPMTILESPRYLITNVTFTSNTAKIGANIYIWNLDYIKIENSTFISNYAKIILSNESTEFGGAISYSASDEITLLELDSTVIFENNTAESSGGVINWLYKEPKNIDLPQYINNKALLYGDDIPCFAQNLIQVSETRSLRVLSNYSDIDILSLSSQKSGNNLPDLYLSLVDKYGQVVGSDIKKWKLTVSISILCVIC